MFIPEFVCGVIFTLLAEIVLLFTYVLVNGKKGKGNGDR